MARRVQLCRGSIIAVTAPAAMPRPMETASPVSFIFLTPFGDSMPKGHGLLHGKIMEGKKQLIVKMVLFSWDSVWYNKEKVLEGILCL
jgi:hypothetical protein